MSKSKTTPAGSPKPQFPVVGIGASAGGLEAIKLFLQALPKKTAAWHLNCAACCSKPKN
jgi:two-component system CheB/CheR fusion protein